MILALEVLGTWGWAGDSKVGGGRDVLVLGHFPTCSFGILHSYLQICVTPQGVRDGAGPVSCLFLTWLWGVATMVLAQSSLLPKVCGREES